MRPYRAVLLALGCLGAGGCTTAEAPGGRARDAAARPPTAADSLIALGERLYLQGEIDSAIVVWQRGRDVAAPDDHLAKGRIGTWLGNAAMRQGRYEDARRLGEEALALKRQHGLVREVPASLLALGLVAWREARLADATVLFREAIAEGKRHDDATVVAKAANNLGLVQVETGAFDEARANFAAAREAGRALGDARLEGVAATNQGMVATWMGDPAAALPHLAAAGRLYRSIGYSTGEQAMYGQLASAYAALGEPQQAFAALDSAIAIARRQGLRDEEALNLEALANLLRDLGDTRRALAHYEQARRLNGELGQLAELGANLRSEADLRAAVGLLVRARADAREALRLHTAAGARWQALPDLLLLAAIEQRAGDTAASAWRLGAARALADSIGTPAARVAVAMADARIGEAAGDPSRVLGALAAADADLTRAGPADGEPDALRARAHAALGALDSAAAAGRRAVAATERVRVRLGAEPLRRTFEAARAPVYVDLVLTLLRMGRTDEAFEVADAARSRTLVERLSGVRRELRDGTAQEAVTAERLLLRIDELTRRLDDARRGEGSERGMAAPEEAELARHLQAARDEYEGLRLRLDARGTAANALLGLRPSSARGVRAALHEGELLVEYLLAADRLVVFALTRDTAIALTMPLREADLSARVRLLRTTMGRADAATGSRDVSRALHGTLLEPLERAGLLHRARRLVVVPHGSLAYVPFAALQAADGRPLSATHAVASVPSATALAALRQRNAPALAAPAAAVEAFAPLPQELPGTAVELAAIRQAIQRTTARSGNEATEALLRRALRGQATVHVASHGVLEAANPLFSHVRLARPSGTPPSADDDGRLEVHELIDLRVSSPIVFLSGCETGVGTTWSTVPARGEEVTALAQAFLHAGASAVVATLWRIDDAGAAVFAERFYRHLAALPPAEALAAAQRDLQRHSRYGSPFHWAAYVLLGEPGRGPGEQTHAGRP